MMWHRLESLCMSNHKHKGEIHKMKTKLFSLMMVLMLLAGCTMVVDPNFQPAASSNQIEPAAGDWQTWVLPTTDEVMPAAPPDQAATLAEIEELKALAAQRDAAPPGLGLQVGDVGIQRRAISA